MLVCNDIVQCAYHHDYFDGLENWEIHGAYSDSGCRDFKIEETIVCKNKYLNEMILSIFFASIVLPWALCIMFDDEIEGDRNEKFEISIEVAAGIAFITSIALLIYYPLEISVSIWIKVPVMIVLFLILFSIFSAIYFLLLQFLIFTWIASLFPLRVTYFAKFYNPIFGLASIYTICALILYYFYPEHFK